MQFPRPDTVCLPSRQTHPFPTSGAQCAVCFERTAFRLIYEILFAFSFWTSDTAGTDTIGIWNVVSYGCAIIVAFGHQGLWSTEKGCDSLRWYGHPQRSIDAQGIVGAFWSWFFPERTRAGGTLTIPTHILTEVLGSWGRFLKCFFVLSCIRPYLRIFSPESTKSSIMAEKRKVSGTYRRSTMGMGSPRAWSI